MKRLATVASSATLVLVAIALAAVAVADLSWERLDPVLVVPNGVVAVAMALVGRPIAGHRSRNPIGWVMLAAGFAHGLSSAGIALQLWAHDEGWDGLVWRALATSTTSAWAWSFGLFLPLLILLFPDGRLPNRTWRYVVAALVVTSTLLWIDTAVEPPSSDVVESAGDLSYLTWTGYEQIQALESAMLIGNLVDYAAVTVAIVLRYRRSGRAVRQQMLWVLEALLVVVVVLAGAAPFVPGTSVLAVLALVPAAVGLSLVRRRLLDIELVFSRTLAYVLLTGAGVLSYLVIVTALQSVVGTSAAGRSVGATLAIAAGFNPLRVWLTARVDRLVHGARRDPVRAIAEVGARLHRLGSAPSSTHELEGLLETWCGVLRFPAAAIVVAGQTVASWGVPGRDRHVEPLWPDGPRRGELVLSLREGEAALGTRERRVVELLVAPTAIAVQATLLSSQLARSREQVVHAREEERRRLHRDLHDGLGPTLTGVVLRADAARRLVPTEPVVAAQHLAELRDQTTTALDDIRRLVYGLRPPSLDSLGLVGALHETATTMSRRADGSALRVTVESEPLPGLPAALEVAAYRIATEALTNVARHSAASVATVTLGVGDGMLHLGVYDDGPNPPEDWRPGVGLTSMRTRAAELGGRCVVVADRDGGRVDVQLPLGQRTASSRAGR